MRRLGCDSTNGARQLIDPELGPIFLGLDQGPDELLYSSLTGANLFKDQRFRLAVDQAIDCDAIVDRIMRGQATASASMVAPGMQGFPESLERHPDDPEAATPLLAAAGYKEGFSVTMDYPDDRYVNDEAICQPVVGMLGRIGIEVDLFAQTHSLYLAKALAEAGDDTSICRLGSMPGSRDSWEALGNLVHSRTEAGAGAVNLGCYSHAEIDELTEKIVTETGLDTRPAMIDAAWQILNDDAGYLPLHQQAQAWSIAHGVEVAQRADNRFAWTHVVKN